MSELTFDVQIAVVIGLAGCAMALVAMALDWRDGRGFEVGFGDEPLGYPEVPPTSWTTTSSGKPGWRVGKTVPADFGTQWAAKDGPLPADLGKRLP